MDFELLKKFERDMRKLQASAMIVLLTITAIASEQPYGGIKLLDGYKFKSAGTFDTINGLIYKEGGLSIEFESGMNEGYAADPKNKNQFLWYREQKISGHKVMLALTKPGVGTNWHPEKPRGSKSGSILIVTFPGRFGPDDAANFHAEVLNKEEIADALLMVLTFDPSK